MLIIESFTLKLDKMHHSQPDDIEAHLSMLGALNKKPCSELNPMPPSFNLLPCKHKGILQCPERSLASESSVSMGDAEPESSVTGKTSAFEGGSIYSSHPLALRYLRSG